MARCTKCGAVLARGAKFCGECGHQVTTGAETKAAPAVRYRAPSPASSGAEKDNQVKGCIGLLVIGVLGFMLFECSWGANDPKQQAEIAAKKAEDSRKGFDCLNAWDGSNQSLVDQIKHNLRDPDSFEHDETKITPEKDGKHMVTMRYRARNGFGGMNVSTAIAEVDHITCKATIISTGEG